MSKRKIFISIVVGIAFTAMAATGQVGKNAEALLKQILSNQEQMQADIAMLKQRLAEKDQEIAELRAMLQKQQTAVKQQAEQVKQVKTQAAEAPQGADVYSARLQYDKVRELMHDVIFEVRKGEQEPWFERVVEEFQKVVEKFPNTPYAEEAQLRIGRIYRRYLDNPVKAKEAFQYLIQNYPNGPHVKEAREALQELQ